MKKIIALVLMTAMLLGAACADVSFTYNAYMGYQGENTAIRIENDGKNAGETVELRDDTGAILAEVTLIRSKGRQNVEITVPTGRAAVTLSLWRSGAEAPDDTVMLAAETRPGYSITRVDRDDKLISITFDSANAPSKTLQILDLLDQYEAKCTFFLQGTFLKANPDVVKEIEARGHEVANHSYSHPNMPDLTNDQIIADFNKSSAIFNEVLGHEPALYRPPSGYSSQRDRAIARALGQEVIKWTVDSRDGFQDSTLNTVIKRVQNNAGSGAIVLMHVYGKHTLKALETLLPWYIEQGYRFVTVSDLLLTGETVIDTDGIQHAAQ